MRHTFLGLGLSLTLAITAARGADDLPVQSFPPLPAAAGGAAGASDILRLPDPSQARTPDCVANLAENLRSAARELDAAGKTNEANQLRARIDADLAVLANRLHFAEAELATLRPKLQSKQQIALSVTVAEISKSRLRMLGVDSQSIVSGDPQLAVAAANLDKIVSGAMPPPAVKQQTDMLGTDKNSMRWGVSDSNQVNVFLHALKKYDLVKIAAEPALVTTSGRPVSYTSGGEIPLGAPDNSGKSSVDFKKYGMQIDCMPVVLESGKLRIDLHVRNSRLDPSHAVQIGGSAVPGLMVREISTSAELMPHQTLALIGWMDRRTEAQNTGVPWLADVPYMGFAFRKVRVVNEEVEMLITVTPQLVESRDAAQVMQNPAEAPRR